MSLDKGLQLAMSSPAPALTPAQAPVALEGTEPMEMGRTGSMVTAPTWATALLAGLLTTMMTPA